MRVLVLEKEGFTALESTIAADLSTFGVIPQRNTCTVKAKPKLYLETSVISQLDAPDTLDKIAEVQRLWGEIKADKYQLAISEVTIDELESCSEPKRSCVYAKLAEMQYAGLAKTVEAEVLSRLYEETGDLPPQSHLDVLHVAIATVHHCDILLSWDLARIVNQKTIDAVTAVNFAEGYRVPKILSPSMLWESEV